MQALFSRARFELLRFFSELQQVLIVQGDDPSALFSGRVPTPLEKPGFVIELSSHEQANSSSLWRGVHVPIDGELLFSFASIKLQDLAAFAGNPQVGISITQDQEGGTVTHVVLESERIVHQMAALPNATVALTSTPAPNISVGSAGITVVVSLEASMRSPSSWETTWGELVLPLRDLFALLLGKAVAVESVTLRSETADNPVRVLLPMPEPVRSSRRAAATHDFVLAADRLPGGFDQGLNAWGQTRTRARVGIRELTDILHAPHAYVDDKLVAYVRAVGPLLNDDGKVVSKQRAEDQHEAWRNEVRAALPEHLRDGVLAKLEAPGPNERHRLIALTKSLRKVGEWLTGGAVEEFAQNVIATRSGLAHPSNKPAANRLHGQSLLAHTVALEWILRAVLLREMGLTEDQLLNILRSTPADQAAAALLEIVNTRLDAG